MGFLNDLDLGSVEADPNHIPDGKYPAYIYTSEIKNKKDGTPSWVLTYKIAPEAPKYVGKTQQEWFDLEPKGDKAEMKKSFLKKRVLSLGVPESRINDLNPGDMQGLKVTISIVHRNGYQNIGDVELAEGNVAAPAVTSAGSITSAAGPNLL